MRTLQLILTLVLFSNTLFGQQTYYVSTQGDNSNDGSENNPWSTIQYAANQVAEEDTIILRAGTYNEDVTISTNHVTIKSFENEFAHISSPFDDDNVFQTVWFNALGGRLINVEVSGGYFYSIKFEQGEGLVKSCKIHGSGRDCIKIVPNADNITIEDCEIYNSGRRDDSNAEGIDNVNGDGMIVRRCFIHDIPTNGAYAKGGARNTLFESNLIMNCGEAGLTLGFFTSLEFFDPEENPNYHGNIDGIIRNNIIVNTGGPGVGMFASLRSKIHNNTMVNVAGTQRGGVHFEPVENNGTLRYVVDPQVINNIVVMGSESSRTLIEERNNAMQGDITFRNNIYFDEDGTPEFRYNGSKLSFTSWVSSITGGDDGSSTSDPLLDENYHLTESSPALDNASTLVGNIIDYDGVLRESTYDIGADELEPTCDITPVPPAPGTIGTGASCGEEVVTIPLNIHETNSGLIPYPNPTNGIIKVSNSDNVKVYDLYGKEVGFSIISKQSINISSLKPGSYILVDKENKKYFHIVKK